MRDRIALGVCFLVMCAAGLLMARGLDKLYPTPQPLRVQLTEVEILDGNGHTLVSFQAATNPSYSCTTTLHGFQPANEGSKKRGLYVSIPVPKQLVIRTDQESFIPGPRCGKETSRE